MRVSHSKTVPTPARWSPRKRMAAASAIQDTWSAMSARWPHTTSGGASIVVLDPDAGHAASMPPGRAGSGGGGRSVDAGQHLGEQPGVDPDGGAVEEVHAVAVDRAGTTAPARSSARRRGRPP